MDFTQLVIEDEDISRDELDRRLKIFKEDMDIRFEKIRGNSDGKGWKWWIAEIVEEIYEVVGIFFDEFKGWENDREQLANYFTAKWMKYCNIKFIPDFIERKAVKFFILLILDKAYEFWTKIGLAHGPASAALKKERGLDIV